MPEFLPKKQLICLKTRQMFNIECQESCVFFAFVRNNLMKLSNIPWGGPYYELRAMVATRASDRKPLKYKTRKVLLLPWPAARRRIAVEVCV